jgi:hypothetical protein
MSRPAAQPAAVHSTMNVEDPSSVLTGSRFTAWPLWATLAGVLGLTASVVTDTRADAYGTGVKTVGAQHMADLDPSMFRVGGVIGYLTVIVLVVLAAVWHRRVVQRFRGSTGALVVVFGLLVSAATLSLAYGWKGALGTYLHGAAEEGTYDDTGLFVYYVMNDFSPYVGWVGVMIALFGLLYMSFREGLVSRALGGVLVIFSVLPLLAVVVTGVPGLPIASVLGLVVAGLWLAVGRSTITQPLD